MTAHPYSNPATCFTRILASKKATNEEKKHMRYTYLSKQVKSNHQNHVLRLEKFTLVRSTRAS